MGSIRTAYFLALLFVGLALGPSFAHLLALPNKIGLSANDYLRVQQIYRGWALLGVVVLGELVATGALAVAVRRRRREFHFALAAFLCVVAAQAVFWAFTYPANAATEQWRMLPADWESQRARWEYSHAAGAVFTLSAFVMLLFSALPKFSTESADVAASG